MPGVMMWSGLMSPGFTSCSTSATVTLPAVAIGVAAIGVDDREVGDQPPLHHITLAVEFADVLAFGDLGAVTGLGEKGRNAGAAGADALGKRALRVELDLEFVGQKLVHERFVLANIGRDHFLDLPGVEENAESLAVGAAIVRHDGEVLDP